MADKVDKQEDKETRIYFDIPEALRRKLKAECAIQGKTVKSVVVEIIENYLKNRVKKEQG